LIEKISDYPKKMFCPTQGAVAPTAPLPARTPISGHQSTNQLIN